MRHWLSQVPVLFVVSDFGLAFRCRFYCRDRSVLVVRSTTHAHFHDLQLLYFSAITHPEGAFYVKNEDVLRATPSIQCDSDFHAPLLRGFTLLPIEPVFAATTFEAKIMAAQQQHYHHHHQQQQQQQQKTAPSLAAHSTSFADAAAALPLKASFPEFSVPSSSSAPSEVPASASDALLQFDAGSESSGALSDPDDDHEHEHEHSEPLAVLKMPELTMPFQFEDDQDTDSAPAPAGQGSLSLPFPEDGGFDSLIGPT